MVPKISTTYRIRALGLCLAPINALCCWSNSFSAKNTALAALTPIAVLVLLDVLEIKEVKRRFASSRESQKEDKPKSIASLAQSGRVKYANLAPKQTGKRYLVVGTGGIGRRISKKLRARGETEIYGFDICPYSAVQEFLDESKFVRGDVTSLESCQEAVKQIQPDVIFHTAAALTYAQRKPHQWKFSYNVNVKGVQNMLQAATDASVKSFVFTSSSAAGLDQSHCFRRVSGNEETFPHTTSKENALSWYSRSKAMAEVEALTFCKDNSKAPALGIIRPASAVFHARDGLSCERGLRDLLVPAIGFEYMTIDHVFVDNVVLGHLLLEKELNQGKCNGETFIISNQETASGLDFAALKATMIPALSYWKVPSTLTFVLATITEVLTSLKLSVPKELGLLTYTTLSLATIEFIMDSSKAEKMLGYKPAFNLKEAVAQTIEEHIEALPETELAKSFGTSDQKKEA